MEQLDQRDQVMLKSLFKVSFGVVAIVLVLALFPALLIWSLNTLFLLEIPYTVKTILAAFVLVLLIGGSSVSNSKSGK